MDAENVTDLTALSEDEKRKRAYRRDPRAVPVPERLKNLPEDSRGYKIFFTIQNEFSGQHNFLAMVPEQVFTALGKRLCGLCGQPLGYWLWFAGGPLSCENRVFVDPPMHKECLDYASQVCPFILSRSYRRVMERSDRPKETVRDEHGVPYETARFGLYRTRSYKWTMQRTGQILIRAAPARGIEWLERGD